MDLFISNQLSSLLPSAKTLAEHVIHEFTKLRTKYKQQCAIIEKLEKEDFIPQSCRVTIPVKGTAEAKETAAHKALVEEMNKKCEEFGKDACKTILSTAQNELTILRDKIRSCICHGLKRSCELYAIQLAPGCQHGLLGKRALIGALDQDRKCLVYSTFDDTNNSAKTTTETVGIVLKYLFDLVYPDEKDIVGRGFALSEDKQESVASLVKPIVTMVNLVFQD